MSKPSRATVAVEEPIVEETAVEVGAERTPSEDRYWFAAGAILILGILLRQWGLGQASFHPDEAIHAFFAQTFATYHYDPTYHGPLLYHLVSGTIGFIGSILALFGMKAPDGDMVALGSNNYTARLVPSLLGITLLWMVLGPARRWLGNKGALCSAALLAVSPSVVAYSRRLLHDSLVLCLTLGALLCFLTALEHSADTSKGRGARIGLFSLLTLFLATKANCFFVYVMLLSYWFVWRFGRRANLPLGNWLAIILWVAVTVASIAFPTPVTGVQHKIFQLLCASALGWMGFWLMYRPEGSGPGEAKPWHLERTHRYFVTYFLCFGAVLWLYVFLFGNGAQFVTQSIQKHHIASELFPQMGNGVRTAIKKMLEYWGGQQAHPRLPGRHDYYVVLSLLYEVPIVLAALGGIWHAARNRTYFTDLLMWWAFTSWTVYAVANEKVPWLLVHIMLPLALLGGLWLGTVFRWRQPVWWVPVALAAVFSLRGVGGTCFERAGDNAEPMFYAHSSEMFHDTVENGLKASQIDGRLVWMDGERQWPTFWYLRRGAPYIGRSSYSFAANPDPQLFRMAITKEEGWGRFDKQGFVQMTKEPVSFLIWPRASWEAIRPDRYWRWWWTRVAIPADERDFSQTQWKKSILSGNGEWSEAKAIVGVPRQDLDRP